MKNLPCIISYYIEWLDLVLKYFSERYLGKSRKVRDVIVFEINIDLQFAKSRQNILICYFKLQLNCCYDPIKHVTEDQRVAPHCYKPMDDTKLLDPTTSKKNRLKSK